MKKNFFYAGGLSLLLWGMAACSGQGKADKAAVVADSVVVKTDSVAADSTGYIVKVGESARFYHYSDRRKADETLRTSR